MYVERTRRAVEARLRTIGSLLPGPVRRAARLAAARLLGDRWKLHCELSYWRRVQANEGTLTNDHYEHFFTTHFGFSRDFYRGKRLLDIGCGPRGSLEWADMTARRVGLNPLADRYRRLGAAEHAMEYVARGSEAIPFPDAILTLSAPSTPSTTWRISSARLPS